MISLEEYEAAESDVKQYRHKKETLTKLRSCPSQHSKVTVTDGDHTGIIQFSIDKPRDLSFTLPMHYLVSALEAELEQLKLNLSIRGILVDLEVATPAVPSEAMDDIPF